METFIVLIAAKGSVVKPRKACELLENTKFKVDGEIKTSAYSVRKKVLFELGIKSSSSVEVETISDFMERVNDQEFEEDNYFMSYVYTYK